MNLVKDVEVIGEIESNWQNELVDQNAEQTNGYDHDEYKLSGDAFKTELKNQVKNMNVSLEDVISFLSDKDQNHEDWKYITIKGKDLYYYFNNTKEDGESDDKDLFGNLIAVEDEDDNENVKFKGQLSLTRNGDNDQEEPINASIKVEGVVSADNKMNLKIFLIKKSNPNPNPTLKTHKQIEGR